MTSVTGNTSVLHLVLSADRKAWQECRTCVSEVDQVVMLDAGVMILTDPDTAAGPSINVAVSSADAAARGLDIAAAPAGVRWVSDDEIVALIGAHSHCLSWR